jgi:hypothetical protein
MFNTSVFTLARLSRKRASSGKHFLSFFTKGNLWEAARNP